MKKILLLLALAAALADATGKWSGSFAITADGETHNDTAFLDLQQDGSKIIGVAGPDAEKANPIKTGSIQGDKIKLEVPHVNGPIYFELTMDGDRMTGDAKAAGEGRSRTGKLDLKREK